jgi:hypothetical protein
MSNNIGDSITQQFAEVTSLIDKVRGEALKSINAGLIRLYWDIGYHISMRLSDASWGDKAVDRLAEYFHSLGPDYKGFNRRNLYRMKQFYEAYPENQIVSALLTQLSWTNHLLILSKTKTPEERLFYLSLAKKEKYSSRELERQLDNQGTDGGVEV